MLANHAAARVLAGAAVAVLVVLCGLVAQPAARVSLEQRFAVVGRGRRGELLVEPVIAGRRLGGRRAEGLRLLGGADQAQNQRLIHQQLTDTRPECGPAWNPEGTPNGCGPTRPARDYGADINLTEETNWMFDNSGAGIECCPCLGRGVNRWAPTQASCTRAYKEGVERPQPPGGCCDLRFCDKRGLGAAGSAMTSSKTRETITRTR
jgi:hypothetical protein